MGLGELAQLLRGVRVPDEGLLEVVPGELPPPRRFSFAVEPFRRREFKIKQETLF